VTAYAHRMERIEQLLEMVDRPGEPKIFRYRQLRYTMAKTLADKVKALAEQMLENVTVTIGTPDCRRPPSRGYSRASRTWRIGRVWPRSGPQQTPCGPSRRPRGAPGFRSPNRASTWTPTSGPIGF
jgi:hypothetical protein